MQTASEAAVKRRISLVDRSPQCIGAVPGVTSAIARRGVKETRHQGAGATQRAVAVVKQTAMHTPCAALHAARASSSAALTPSIRAAAVKARAAARDGADGNIVAAPQLGP